MKINKIKLLSDYKIFQRNTEFNFNNSNLFAVVGVNGSGKSIFQEVVINIFMNIYAKINKHRVYVHLNYDIEYTLVPTTSLYSVILEENSSLSYSDLKEIVVKVKNDCDDFKINIFYRDKFNTLILVNINDIKLKNLFLPNSLVVYSSGENETISNELLRYRLLNQNRYFENMYNVDKINDLKMKLVYVHDNYRSLLILTMLLFNDESIREIKKLLDIEKLSSFTIEVNFKLQGLKKVVLPQRESYEIAKLFKFFNGEFTISDVENLNGTYNINFSNKSEIVHEEYLGNPQNFYRTLESLENLNLLKISLKKRRQIEKEINHSIKDIHSFYTNEKKVFKIKDTHIKKQDNNYIDLTGLSDGEYQIALIMALFVINNNKNTLFILDEPDTHFNPEWKAKFVALLSEVKNGDSQCIFSTHNPEVLTDMKNQDILLIKDHTPCSVDLNTFATNPNIIASKIFNRNNTISEIASREYRNFNNMINKEESNEGLEEIEKRILIELGNSSERLVLLNKIYKKKKE